MPFRGCRRGYVLENGRSEGATVSENLIHGALTHRIIGAAMAVLNTLKPGLDEKIYERALIIELRKRGHAVDPQRQHEVYYDGERVGTLIPDLIVDDLVIVDTKVVSAFSESHVAKMIGYLAITDLEVALLLNFRYAELGWKRVVR
jgi:GxxExxY protein